MQVSYHRLYVELGGVFAHCPNCWSSEFVAEGSEEEITFLSTLVCSACEQPTTKADLILQIGGEALKQAGERLRSCPLRVIEGGKSTARMPRLRASRGALAHARAHWARAERSRQRSH
jgi:hypothetical protein